MDCNLGEEVGYSIRFEDLTSAKTRIKFLTDGLLLREALADPLLSRYSVIMVDEAHERSLSSDVLLGILKKILKRRPDLKVIISSATIQAEDFLNFFSGDEMKTKGGKNGSNNETGKIISLEGRTYPIDVLYLEIATEDYIEATVKAVFEIHSNEADGDILAFLTGREEIDKVIQIISDRALELDPKSQGVLPLPLYAGLNSEQQLYVFDVAPENTRKVILSTNIAEASVTIDGIVYVIDCGFVKLRAFNPKLGIETLHSTAVSKASATQRAGRAGRTKPGKCFRLYTEADHASLQETTPPEIQRSNLAPMILQLKALGIDNVLRFNFLTAPPSDLFVRALELLFSIGALDEYAKLTRPLGMRMAELSVEPMMAKVLLSAPSLGCLSEILSIAAMISLQSAVWYTEAGEKGAMDSARRKFAAEEGDHLTLLNVYQTFVTKGKKESKWCHDNGLNYKSMTRAVSIRNQLRRYLERFGIDVTESLAKGRQFDDSSGKASQIRRCLTLGYFAHAARMQPDGTFSPVNGGLTLHAHPTSLMFVSQYCTWLVGPR